jgi:AcrR family transcriptional regulator
MEKMETDSGKQSSSRGTGRWKQNPEKTKSDIVAVASREFAEHGLAGARIDRISEKTATSKRMIYYYFGDKEGLYLTCLEAAYQRVRTGQLRLDIDEIDPVEALEQWVEYIFRHHNSDTDFVRMVMIENIHRAGYLAKSKKIRQYNSSAIKTLKDIYDRGVANGQFRAGVDVKDINWFINAGAFFNVSNRSTFELLTASDQSSEEFQSHRCAEFVRMVIAYVQAD